MKKLVGFILGLFLVACADSSKEASNNAELVLEGDNLEYEMKLKNRTVENLALENLKSYFELLRLKNEHPEFQVDIKKQLKEFSEEGIIDLDIPNNFTVANIRKVAESAILPDSVQSMIFYYDITSGNQTKTDSITALISTEIILLDGVETKSTKISFLMTH